MGYMEQLHLGFFFFSLAGADAGMCGLGGNSSALQKWAFERIKLNPPKAEPQLNARLEKKNHPNRESFKTPGGVRRRVAQLID